MGITVVVIGLPNYVTINMIAQCFDTLFDSAEIGSFYLCDFREAKYKWHKWQIALHFNSYYDAIIAQNMLDGYNFLVNTTVYLLHARIRNDPNMLNNRLFNMVEVKMLRRSYSIGHRSKLRLYYLHSDMCTQNHTLNYPQQYMKDRYPKRGPKAPKLPPTIMYSRGFKSLGNETVKNQRSSEPPACVNNLNISNNEAQPMSAEDIGNTRCKLLQVDDLPVIEDNTDQMLDPINHLNQVESPLQANTCHDEIDNDSYLDIEDKIWDTIDEVLQDIRTDMVKPSLDKNELYLT